MAKDGERETGYVRKVQEDTRRYVEKLLKENETLRTVLVKKESAELALEEKVLTLKEQLSRHEREQVSLRRQMAEIEANNQRFTKEYLEIEHQNANLASRKTSPARPRTPPSGSYARRLRARRARTA